MTESNKKSPVSTQKAAPDSSKAIYLEQSKKAIFYNTLKNRNDRIKPIKHKEAL